MEVWLLAFDLKKKKRHSDAYILLGLGRPFGGLLTSLFVRYTTYPYHLSKLPAHIRLIMFVCAFYIQFKWYAIFGFSFLTHFSNGGF